MTKLSFLIIAKAVKVAEISMKGWANSKLIEKAYRLIRNARPTDLDFLENISKHFGINLV
jgi:hypothetical protein